MGIRRRRLNLYVAALFMVAAAASFHLYGCRKRPPDEELVREAVMRAASSAAKKDVPAFMRLISKDYADDNGNDFNAIKGMMVYQLLRPENVSVFVRGMEVEVVGDKASVDAKVVVARGRDVKGVSDIVPEEADAMRFKVILKKENGEWRALNAVWASVGVAGLI